MWFRKLADMHILGACQPLCSTPFPFFTYTATACMSYQKGDRLGEIILKILGYLFCGGWLRDVTQPLTFSYQDTPLLEDFNSHCFETGGGPRRQPPKQREGISLSNLARTIMVIVGFLIFLGVQSASGQ